MTRVHQPARRGRSGDAIMPADPSRLTQRGPRKRDTVNEGHETSWMLQVRIGEVFAYGCVLSFQKEGRKDPKSNSEMTPGSTGQGWEGGKEAQAVSACGSEGRTAAPAESQLEPIPQGVSLWMGPHLEPLHSHAGVLPPW